MLDISKSVLTLYESGKLSAPLSVIVKMIKVYNSNTYDLLGVYAPELRLTDTEKLYNTICEYIVGNISRMENTRKSAGLSGYANEYREELFNEIFLDFTERISDEVIRTQLREMHHS